MDLLIGVLSSSAAFALGVAAHYAWNKLTSPDWEDFCQLAPFGRKFLAHVPAASSNKVQMVRRKLVDRELNHVDVFVNDHGNEVIIDAFFVWPDPKPRANPKKS